MGIHVDKIMEDRTSSVKYHTMFNSSYVQKVYILFCEDNIKDINYMYIIWLQIAQRTNNKNFEENKKMTYSGASLIRTLLIQNIHLSGCTFGNKFIFLEIKFYVKVPWERRCRDKWDSNVIIWLQRPYKELKQ